MDEMEDFSSLPEAIQAQRFDVALEMLEGDPSLVDLDDDFAPDTPLHLLAGQTDGLNRFDLFHKIIAIGVEVNTPGVDDFTPLHLAVEYEDSEMTEWLLAHGADPNCSIDTGLTSLIETSSGRNPAILGMLLMAGAKIDLYSAVNLGRADWVRWLLRDQPLNEWELYCSPYQLVSMVVVQQQSEILQLLIDQGLDLNHRHGTQHFLTDAVSYSKGSVRMTQLMLNNGANPDGIFSDGTCSSTSPLMSARK